MEGVYLVRTIDAEHTDEVRRIAAECGSTEEGPHGYRFEIKIAEPFRENRQAARTELNQRVNNFIAALPPFQYANTNTKAAIEAWERSNAELLSCYDTSKLRDAMAPFTESETKQEDEVNTGDPR
jgi:hypothetical protein